MAAPDVLNAVGAAGYQVGNQVVWSMLMERLNVVVDAVNPVADARQGWVVSCWTPPTSMVI